MTKLVLIDGNAIMHRAYHALPKTLTSKNKKPINAVYGFVSMLLRIIQDLAPSHLAVAFDRKEPTFRHEQFKDYQAHRPEMDDELSEQFEVVKKVITSFGIPIYEKAGFEADDVIGTIAFSVVRSLSAVDSVVIVTGDRDMLQLVTDKINLYMPGRSLTDATLYGPKETKKKMGVVPSQIVDYKALVGDPSDNYPGVKGIGPKTAENLLKKFNNLDNIYANLDQIENKTAKLLKDSKDMAYKSQKLAEIATTVPETSFDLDDANDWGLGRQEIIETFDEIGFKTLKQRVNALAIKNKDSNQMELV